MVFLHTARSQQALTKSYHNLLDLRERESRGLLPLDKMI